MRGSLKKKNQNSSFPDQNARFHFIKSGILVLDRVQSKINGPKFQYQDETESRLHTLAKIRIRVLLEQHSTRNKVEVTNYDRNLQNTPINHKITAYQLPTLKLYLAIFRKPFDCCVVSSHIDLYLDVKARRPSNLLGGQIHR